jgi:hypothetical protein
MACVVDWELASKFVPLIAVIISIGIAGFVYWAWHKQKGKEVIANEAKEAIKELLELLNIHMKLINKIRISCDIDNTVHEKITEKMESLYRKLYFIESCMEIENLNEYITKSQFFIKKIDEIIDILHNYKKVNSADMAIEREKYISNLIEYSGSYYNYSDLILDTIKPYALYKKKYNFR